MDKYLAGLFGAMGALATAVPSHEVLAATLGDSMDAKSYGDLLKPIPNAAEKLKALDALEAHARTTAGPYDVARVQLVQYHHHHHHHHDHHHHHHHWQRYYVPPAYVAPYYQPPYYAPAYPPPYYGAPRYYPHHHHHHHHAHYWSPWQ
jgi:hypothetical protein